MTPTNPTPSDLEMIAKGLTKAQRDMLVESEPGGWGRDDTACGAEIIGSVKWARRHD